MSDSHKHRWIEIGRAFPFADADYDPDYLSPEGVHDPDSGELVRPGEMSKALREHFEDKVPTPTPHVILQCADADCKHIDHVELTKDEWSKLRDALENGDLDPDRNGTNRLVSQASLDDLGLGRIAKKLDDPSASGAREALIA